jgi:hypothetical protein
MIEKVFGKHYAHPWIFAVYYVFFPFIINYQHLLIGAVVKPFLLVCLLTSVGFLLLWWMTREKDFAAILTSLLLILFFSYPPIYTLSQLISKTIGGGVISFPQSLQISIIWILLTVILTVWMLLLANKKAPQSLPYLTIALNAASVLLVLISALYLVTKIVQARSTAGFAAGWEQELTTEITAGETAAAPKPDIYLIVVDGYASKEVLADIYGYDNSAFENELTRLGFSIIPNGRTNYNQTRTSFSSLLNMQYLDEVAAEVGEETTDAHPLITMIQDNRVTRRLRQEGYNIINLPSGYEYTEGIQADVQLKPWMYLDNFSQTLLWNSILYPFIHSELYNLHRGNISYSINGLADVSKAYGTPKFVIAHIFAPHPPFVFDEKGNPLTPEYPFTAIDADTLIQSTSKEYYRSHYQSQLKYVSARVLLTVQAILKHSPNSVIILQGDHGPGLTLSLTNVADTNQYERMHILDALYLPGVDASQLSAEHTPVNTFRLILNSYFGDNLPLLENRSFVSSYDHPYQFEDVTEAVR